MYNFPLAEKLTHYFKDVPAIPSNISYSSSYAYHVICAAGKISHNPVENHPLYSYNNSWVTIWTMSTEHYSQPFSSEVSEHTKPVLSCKQPLLNVFSDTAVRSLNTFIRVWKSGLHPTGDSTVSQSWHRINLYCKHKGFLLGQIKVIYKYTQ